MRSVTNPQATLRTISRSDAHVGSAHNQPRPWKICDVALQGRNERLGKGGCTLDGGSGSVALASQLSSGLRSGAQDAGTTCSPGNRPLPDAPSEKVTSPTPILENVANELTPLAVSATTTSDALKESVKEPAQRPSSSQDYGAPKPWLPVVVLLGGIAALLTMLAMHRKEVPVRQDEPNSPSTVSAVSTATAMPPVEACNVTSMAQGASLSSTCQGCLNANTRCCRVFVDCSKSDECKEIDRCIRKCQTGKDESNREKCELQCKRERGAGLKSGSPPIAAERQPARMNVWENA